METAGYIASLLIGISLGVIGGGGSILTVPVMVYFFGLQPLLATSYSLFIVGSTSLVGAINKSRKGLVDVRAAILLGVFSVVTVFLTRKFLVPAIPTNLFSVKGFTVTESMLTMLLFAVLMIVASINMIRKKSNDETPSISKSTFQAGALIISGIAIGLVTGLLGAGGGFLLIPALVFYLKLPMKNAIGTSLLIIALNSLIGFTGDIGHITTDWIFLITTSLIAIAGIFIGDYIGQKFSGHKLKTSFGWFVLAMGIYIIVKEILFNH